MSACTDTVIVTNRRDIESKRQICRIVPLGWSLIALGFDYSHELGAGVHKCRVQPNQNGTKNCTGNFHFSAYSTLWKFLEACVHFTQRLEADYSIFAVRNTRYRAPDISNAPTTQPTAPAMATGSHMNRSSTTVWVMVVNFSGTLTVSRLTRVRKWFSIGE